MNPRKISRGFFNFTSKQEVNTPKTNPFPHEGTLKKCKQGYLRENRALLIKTCLLRQPLDRIKV